MTKVRVLIADDSVVYRTQIRSALSVYKWIEVVGTASNGRLALERLTQTTVDLLILDLEMPEMNGLQTLVEISKLGISTKILVFSSISKRGADITFEALRMGAQDFITKPGGPEEAGEELVNTNPAQRIQLLLEPKLRALFSNQFESKEVAPATQLVVSKYPKILWEVFRPNVVVFGSSTGGPTALEKIIQQIGPQIMTPILIAQHMPPVFTASLAERIFKLSGIRTKEGEQGETIEKGCIYIAPGNFHMTITGTITRPTIKLDQGPLQNSVRPAVDPLFASAAKIYGTKCLSIVLTGMGQDGKIGAQAVKDAGGAVVIQDRETSVVFGMPGAVHDCGAYDKISSLDEIAALLRSKISSNSIEASLKGAGNA